ncbi:hypothetical protein K2173_010737 [Erythroxylum novogranatense]|uniref:Uncharacterized protein n=1 Tax=Erythroxylum novogranatense TaxID=1862640 RepID=A0AAV8SQU2_9ROSI|nr:hypothetical protein K2173_010737 [Erythroxylum novogranatense]
MDTAAKHLMRCGTSCSSNLHREVHEPGRRLSEETWSPMKRRDPRRTPTRALGGSAALMASEWKPTLRSIYENDVGTDHDEAKRVVKRKVTVGGSSGHCGGAGRLPGYFDDYNSGGNLYATVISSFSAATFVI